MSQVMKLLPPSPVTSQVRVDIRLGTWPSAILVTVRLQQADGQMWQLYSGVACSHGDDPLVVALETREFVGENLVLASFYDAGGVLLGEVSQPLTVLASKVRSTGEIGGAWCNFYHWSEEEGRCWNPVIKTFEEDDWREVVRGMHSLGMDIIVLQELFRNQAYFGEHDIPGQGYHGQAFYESSLFPGRVDIGCPDPVEAIMAEADELGMSVLPGIGMYAWFDFTPESLAWHEAVAGEVFQRYGHHPSFYGWYVSEEVFGNLNYGERTVENIIDFFREFRCWKNARAAAMPVMLAPNCFELTKTPEAWERLAAVLDIICPFGFNRMGKDDLTPSRAMNLLQGIADKGGAHLWLDMEAFEFAKDQTLIPRNFADLQAELAVSACFEKILCYQYPGMFTAPEASKKLGGEAAVKLYEDYTDWRKGHRYQSIRAETAP